MTANFKTPPFVSKKLREFARGQPCTLMMPWCNHDTETTVLCHIRRPWLSGIASKPHDFFGYHGCSDCHAREAEAGDDDILRALTQTQNRVYAKFRTLTP